MGHGLLVNRNPVIIAKIGKKNLINKTKKTFFVILILFVDLVLVHTCLHKYFVDGSHYEFLV